MQGVPDNEIRERTGTVLKLSFKDGNYVREYIDEAGFTLRKYFYLKEKNQFYFYNSISSPDTLYFSDASEASDEGFKITTGPPATILNCLCTPYEIKENVNKQIITTTFYFCPTLPVDPGWYKAMYIWKDVIKLGKSLAIKFIEDFPLMMKETYTATKITWQSLPDDMFKIDPKLVLAKLPTQ